MTPAHIEALRRLGDEFAPVADEQLYIDADEGVDEFLATHRTYCEKCKRTHLGF